MPHAVIQEVDQAASVSDADLDDIKPLRKDRKNTTIIGEPFLGFECNGRHYIRLGDLELEQDTRAMSEPGYRGFFYGFGDKVTYVISVRALQTYHNSEEITNYVFIS